MYSVQYPDSFDEMVAISLTAHGIHCLDITHTELALRPTERIRIHLTSGRNVRCDEACKSHTSMD